MDMEKQEIISRSKVLTNYFEGRNWDKNGEYGLKRQLVLNRHELLPECPYLIEYEWEFTDNRTDLGCGDLVFTDGDGRFAVVEVKYLDLALGSKIGTTRRVGNRKKRRKVEEQAIEYARIYRLKLMNEKNIGLKSIKAYYFTNECNRPILIDTHE
jgi:hypothetical protein